jgi:hypothetical protein
MKPKTILRAGLPLAACAAAFCATEVWNTKDPLAWTTEDANIILNNSPWAKQMKISAGQSGPVRRGGGGRRGGMGYPGGGYPGGGYPGGGYPGGQGRGGGGGANSAPMTVVVRWESAKPVQEAEKRLQGITNPDSADSKPDADTKPAANPFENHYVVSVTGLRLSGRQSSRDDDQDSGSSRGGSTNSMKDQLMSTTQLVSKGRVLLSPDDIKFNMRNGENQVQFFFPKTTPISMDDKEVTFHATINRMKVENKFNLKKMTRNKKLELD